MAAPAASPVPTAARLPALPRLGDYPGHYARLCPDREALIQGRVRLSWAQFASRVDECARALLAAGVGRGDRVAMLSTPRPEFMVVFLATVRIGAIWIGLNPRHRLDELSYVVGDTGPRVLVSLTDFEGRDYRPDLAALAERHPGIERLVTFGGPAPAGAADLAAFLAPGGDVGDAALAEACGAVATGDPAAIIYTSGSTGQPKGAMLSHHGLVTSFLIQYEHWPAVPLQASSCFPIDHIGGAGSIALYVLVAGGTLVLLERFSARAVLDAIERERITVLHQVPTMYQLMIEESDFDRRDLSSLQRVGWAGAAAPRDLVVRLQAIGARLHNNYGLTESGDGMTYTDEGATLDELVETVGRPDPRFEVKLAGPDGRPVAQGETGEICFRHSIMMLGYWRRPEATAEAIDRDGWLHTGDLAVERPDGNMKLVGRLKEMFKSGGYNIYPREIEGVIEAHPAVAMAAVVGVPDPLYDEVGHAFVLCEPGTRHDAAAIEAHCRERLANYKVPKRFVLRRELPMLPVGKIDRQALKREAAAADASGEI